MKVYRSRLDSGEFEYARIHDTGRAEYFDDELRIWLACESLHDEIADDATWTRCSDHEVEHDAEAGPGATFDDSRVLV